MLEDDVNRLIKILEKSNIDELDVSTFWGKQRIRIRKKIENYNKDIEINGVSSDNEKIENAIAYKDQYIKSDTAKLDHGIENIEKTRSESVG